MIAVLERDLDVAEIVAWITAIPFAEWPQQHRIDEQLRPAMVNDPEWHGMRERTDALVWSVVDRHFPNCEPFNRMLSVVMPRHSIPAHVDAQEPSWVRRVHVPLTTSPNAVMIMGGQEHAMSVGTAYVIDTRAEHAIRNDGATPRIHFMFDIRSPR